MPKIYTDEVMQMVWEAVTTEHKSIRKIATELKSEMATINLIYEAARKRFYKKVKNEVRRKPISRNTPSIVQKFQRPPAVYSNRSPYGIARPGIK